MIGLAFVSLARPIHNAPAQKALGYEVNIDDSLMIICIFGMVAMKKKTLVTQANILEERERKKAGYEYRMHLVGRAKKMA